MKRRIQHRLRPTWARLTGLVLFLLLCVLVAAPRALAQADQGTITGTVEDADHAAVAHAILTLTDTATGLTLKTTSDAEGVYVFSPLKVGPYKIVAAAAGFETTTLTGISVDVNQRTGVNILLKTGAATSTITVNGAGPRLQTEQSSVGTTFTAKTIDDTPLNGRNYVFIAQLGAGVAEANIGARGTTRGDFSSNGQRVEQNNFILDGIDNNSNLVDFLNGASYVIKPPPDALSEFKVETSNYSAELGHSAGAVINASIKSGTNQLRGSVWEYFRNDVLDAKDYFALSKPEYRQNQFGGTLGGPIIRNKLFFFADTEANRVIFEQLGTYTVPTALMRTGNFTELLNPALTGVSYKRLLYQPNTGGGANGTALLSCNGQQNVICPNQISPSALKLINAFPLPNLGSVGQTNNNYRHQGKASENYVSYDARVDWNMSSRNQAFARYSNYNDPQYFPPPLGIMDGGGFGLSGSTENEGRSFALSETHIFSPALVNELRLGYNWIRAQLVQFGANTNESPQYGLGGIPYSAGQGGLPKFSISGVSAAGTPNYYHANEAQNVAQILDNVTHTIGRHTLKAGGSIQQIRFLTLQPQQPRGSYTFTGLYTENLANPSQTGFGVADFLLDQINSSTINNIATTHDGRYYWAAFLQDDWKVTPTLTLNLGARYEYFQPMIELDGRQANFVPDYANGTGQFLIPRKQQNTPIPPSAVALFQQSGIAVVYTGNDSLVQSQKTNISPRIGFAYSPLPTTVVRAGFGFFYGGLENLGYGPNIGQNIPFVVTSTFPSGACKTNACPANGQTLEDGFSSALAAGLTNFAATPALHSTQTNVQNAYSEQYNFSVQQSLPKKTTVTFAYVGSVTRHLQLDPQPNQINHLIPNGASTQAASPFPLFGSNGRAALLAGIANYNGLQITAEHRLSNGLYFLGTYTWSHALDDAPPPLGGSGDTGNFIRNWRQLGFGYDYGSSNQDVRQRVTADIQYELPFGQGRQYLNHSDLLNLIAGGWSSTLLVRAQTGQPAIVSPSFDTTNGVGKSYAFRTVNDPFKAGHVATVSTGSTCATSTRNVRTWFNPCAFDNPPDATGANGLAPYGPRGKTEVYGPGYHRVDLSAFKDFNLVESQVLQFRADIFNVFNTPAFGQPNTTLGSNAGQITSERYGGQGLAGEIPDARVTQLSLKYSF